MINGSTQQNEKIFTMKIEIAENLASSYLKHIEGCRIVQTNWTTSNTWKTTEYDEKLAKEKFFGEYFLTSQWVDYHWEPFLSWLREINNDTQLE